MKMANMDSAFDFMFTSPKDDKGVSIILNFFFDQFDQSHQSVQRRWGEGGGGLGQCSHCLHWQ